MAKDITTREWLDTLRRGWGAKFAAAFEAVGIDLLEDLLDPDLNDMLDELKVELKFSIFPISLCCSQFRHAALCDET